MLVMGMWRESFQYNLATLTRTHHLRSFVLKAQAASTKLRVEALTMADYSGARRTLRVLAGRSTPSHDAYVMLDEPI
jgi:hypothetical protein